VDSVAPAIVKLRHLISGFNRSCKRKRELLAKQAERGLPQHQPIHDEPTRWGSTFEMVDRFLEQQSAFCAVLAEDRKSWALMPQDADICVYEVVKQVLGPINQFTDAVSGEKEVSISCVQPILWKIFAELAVTASDTALAREMKQVIADDLKRRYSDSDLMMLLDCATYLDVRFKKTFVADVDKVKAKLVTETVQQGTTGNPEVMMPNTDSTDGEPPSKQQKQTNGLTTLLGTIRCEKQQSDNSFLDHTDTMSTAMQIQNELLLYDEVSEVAIDSSPLLWWKKNCDCFKHLAELAKKYLCIAATSVASERVFSTSGNVVSAKRSRLDPDTVNQLTFLAKNLDLADSL
jgi:hypothetical protein